jgi:GT2 family glycosyltransferase
MHKKVAIIITPNWRDYAKKYLDDCLQGLRAQDYPGVMTFYITDNESNNDSYRLLKEKMSEAKIHRNKINDGFAKGVNDSLRSALKDKHDYYFVVNIDSKTDLSCVTELVKAAERDKKIGAVQARIMLWPEKDKINSLGNVTHFLGFGYSKGYKEKIKNQKSKIKNITDIHYPSGAGVLFSREALEKVGLYDEEYWMYNEDQEHGWRLWLAGYRCILAPQAVVYHKYEFAKSIKQYYWMDRNRIITVVLCYHALTLLLISPAFVIMELGLILFSIRTGWFREKLKVWIYFFSLRTWRYLFKARKRNQGLKIIKDKEITKLISGRIWYQEIDDIKLRLVNPVFNFYWQIVKFIIIW